MSKDDHLDNDKEELKLDGVTTYHGLVQAINRFAERLAKQSLGLDEQVKNYNILPQQRQNVVSSTIENFVYTVIKTREKVLEEAHTQSKLKAFAGEVEKAIGEDERIDIQSDFDKIDVPHLETDRYPGLDGVRQASRNLLRAKQRESLKAIKEKAGIE